MGFEGAGVVVAVAPVLLEVIVAVLGSVAVAQDADADGVFADGVSWGEVVLGALFLK